MSRYYLDIETDDLLLECTRMWILCIIDVDTEEVTYWLEGDLGWKEVLDNAELIIGHNVLGFDLFAIEKLFGYKLPKSCKVHDTMLMSQVLDYKRFGEQGHSLKQWGIFLGDHKGDFTDFSKYSEEMLDYCIQDVRLLAKIYSFLTKEFETKSKFNNKLGLYLQAEHHVLRWASLARLHGWPFDLEAAKELEKRLMLELEKAYTALNSKLGTRAVPVDKVKGEVEAKKPKWTRDGFYDQHTARWFGVNPCSGYEGEERMIEGPYCRIEFKPLSLDSVTDVKLFLYRNGWQPTEWNYKFNEETQKKEKTSPKITEDSLEFLGGDGKLYLEFLTAKSRHSVLKTWISNTDSEGNLHGDCITIGTPSMRSRHNIIVNVPSSDSAWGPEMRLLFKCKPGWKLIGCDSAGNQARGLAHYLKNADFTDILLNGDIHQYNANILTAVLKGMGVDYEVKRSQAKRILYAFLFGASGGKLWSYIFGGLDIENGNRLKEGFLKAVPGFSELVDNLKKYFNKTKKENKGYGYIPSIAGNRVYVDSNHKLLVYLLQSCEKVTCSAAAMLTMQRLEEEGIPYIPCIMMHDEIDFQVPEEFAERAAAIGKQAFADGPKLFGIDIMDGDAKIGYNWYDVH